MKFCVSLTVVSTKSAGKCVLNIVYLISMASLRFALWHKVTSLLVRQLNVKWIIVVSDSTLEVPKIKPAKQIWLVGDSNPWPMQYRCSALARSTNCAKKSTGSWSFSCRLINTWKDDDEIIKYIWKYYDWTAGRGIKYCKEDHGSLRPTLAVVKKKLPPTLLKNRQLVCRVFII